MASSGEAPSPRDPKPGREIALSIDPERRRTLRSGRLWIGVICVVALTAGLDRLPLLWRCAHPWALLAAFAAGHIVFGLSRTITRLSLREGWWGMVASVRFLYRPYGGGTMGFYLVLALTEELAFRAVPLSFLAGHVWQVAALAAGFAALHILPTMIVSRGLPWLRLVDLLVFGCLLGGLFVWLGDLWPLVIIHWIRNASVAKVLVRKERMTIADGERSSESL